jgi:hypothetical protein
VSDEPETKPEGDEQATATAAEGKAPEQQEKLYTSAQMEHAIRERLERDRKSRTKPEATTPNAQKKEPQPTPGNDDVLAKVAALEAKAALAEAISELDWKPAKEDAETLRDAYKAGGPELFAKLAGRLKPASPVTGAKSAEPANGSYKSPGAPQGAPPETLHQDATKWSADYVARLRADGTFLQELEKYRASMPGGGGGLFRKRIPKVS